MTPESPCRPLGSYPFGSLRLVLSDQFRPICLRIPSSCQISCPRRGDVGHNRGMDSTGRRPPEGDRPDAAGPSDPRCPRGQGLDPDRARRWRHLGRLRLPHRVRAAPAQRAVLDDLATRLGVPVDHLLRGVTAREYDEIKLTLDFAELSLESGQHLEAESRAREALDRAILGLPGRARLPRPLTVARALEGQGSLDDAILELEPLVDRARAAACSASVRDRPVPLPARGRRPERRDRGRRARRSAELDGTPARQLRRGRADGRDPGRRLLRARRPRPRRPHLPQGDHQGRDTGIADGTRRRRTGTPASSSRSGVRSADAVPLAERALALCSPRARTLATSPACGPSSASCSSGSTRPMWPRPRRTWTKAADELAWSSASTVDVARNDLALARSHYLDGEHEPC